MIVCVARLMLQYLVDVAVSRTQCSERELHL